MCKCCRRARPFGGYSNLNVVAGQTIPNLVVVPVGADGSVTVFSERGTHVIVDVFGYFTNEAAPESTDGLFVPLSPTRLLDTRGGAMPADSSTTTVDPRGRAGIPATGVAAVFGNVTATDSTGGGYVQVAPGPAADGAAGFWSNVNIERPHQTIANAAIANLGTDGTLVLYAATATHLLFDAAGYFTADTVPNHCPVDHSDRCDRRRGRRHRHQRRRLCGGRRWRPAHIAAFNQPADGTWCSSPAAPALPLPPLGRIVSYVHRHRRRQSWRKNATGTVTVHIVQPPPPPPPPPPPSTIPLDPTNVTGQVTSWQNSLTELSTEQVFLQWTDVANETGYHVYEDYVGCGPGPTFHSDLLATVPADATSTVVTARGFMWRACLSLRLRVTAFNSTGESRTRPVVRWTIPSIRSGSEPAGHYVLHAVQHYPGPSDMDPRARQRV